MSGADGGWTITPLGETVLLLECGDRIDAAINAAVHAAAQRIQTAHLAGVTDIVPTFAALAVHYDPAHWAEPPQAAWRRCADAVRAVLAAAPTTTPPAPRQVDIPVCYEDAFGPDLDALARHAGLDRDEAIHSHCAVTYQVAMLGFAPGFPYLLGLDPRLHAPRLADPRRAVPAGSVAIGGGQTGIYPAELPGGWQLIGRTPLRLFDPLREPACLLAAGDQVRFHPIDGTRFARLATP